MAIRAEDTHGHAIYIELVHPDDATRVTQIILVGYMAYNSEVVPYRMISRTITEINPTLPYRQDWDEVIPEELIPYGSTFTRVARPEAGTLLAKEAWEYLSGALDVFTLTGWTVRGNPIIVQVSQLDAVDLKVASRPKKLIDRIMRVRATLPWAAPLPSKAARA